jgi:UDP-N-acetylglucosamine 2-epimerase (non-hydrolysing)
MPEVSVPYTPLDMKIMTVVGARPNFMKAAPIIAAIRDHNNPSIVGDQAGRCGSMSNAIRHLLVHTGQHYDPLMSGSFFADLNLPTPDVDLGVGSGSHAIQTGEIMRRFEEVLLRERPDILVLVGDVNSTLACALVAAKICYDASGARPLVAHVEAGLRSFDRTMPEEINRVLTDQLSDLLFVTEDSGLRNLALEGVAAQKVHLVGNTMIDSLLSYKDRAEASAVLDLLGLKKVNGAYSPVHPYALLTLHRPANVDGGGALWNILRGLEELARELPIIFPAHPRTQSRIREFRLERYFKPGTDASESSTSHASVKFNAIRMIDPLGYLDFLCLMKHAALVVTDSGGIQEETTCLGIPCVTVRENTERPVTVESGTNVVAGTTKENIAAAIRRQMQRDTGHSIPEMWDGQAAKRIVDILICVYRKRTSSQNVPVPQACI